MGEPRAITIGVVHCDLRQAQYPVAVGHYVGDVIVNAEAVLDAALGGALRHRFDLGIYPGPVGTSEIVLGGRYPPGAIVVGLGEVGELTPERLRLVLATALRRYALETAEANTAPTGVGVSSVLVGTDGGAFAGVTDSIHSIIRGAIDVNRALADAQLADRVWIGKVEFVELHEDIAIRAAQAVQDLPSTLAAELRNDITLDCKQRLDTRPGGRYLRPADPYASGWWQRVAIRKKTADPGAASQTSETTTALQFTVLSDRARLEQDVAVAQRALIDRLMTSATGGADYDEDLSAALYQLLVPGSIKDRIRRGGDLLLMVDRAGAGYPYELMAEKTDRGIRPLIASRGILRQFETGQYRPQPEMARADRIFIVGDPKTFTFAPLRGAEAEAESVAKIASAHNLQVVSAPRENGERTIVMLTTTECRILHFAAHGVFDPDPMKSGVVVSDRLRITPAEVKSLPLVPELVFLNCCYLGKMDEARSSGPDPRLAASLAEGFIQTGLRAVIAAGWAVDDHAGGFFARSFYEKFLTGDTFGTAVQKAREATRNVYPQSNTWGAYQCYGNPDYRFRRYGAAPPAKTERAFVARSEALEALRTLASRARSMRAPEAANLAAESHQLFADISGDPADNSRPNWIRDGEVLAVCGEICGELEEFDRAIDFYRRALATVPASAPLTVVEQLANLLSRFPTPEISQNTEPDKHFAEALSWLDWLDRRLPPTKERRALRGALFKRWAVRDPVHRRMNLKKAEAAYSEGAKLAANSGYQQLNALALKFVLGSAAVRKELRVTVDGYVEPAQQRFEEVDRDFWDVVELADVLLHKYLICGSLPNEVDDVIHKYDAARAAGPSLRQWASVRDHIMFLAAMTADCKLRCYNPEDAEALKTICESLKNQV
jgi:tetratricopeptide (TPR) repeat protein